MDPFQALFQIAATMLTAWSCHLWANNRSDAGFAVDYLLAFKLCYSFSKS